MIKKDLNLDILLDEQADNHFSANEETPLRNDAFDLSDAEKIARIKKDVHSIIL